LIGRRKIKRVKGGEGGDEGKVNDRKSVKVRKGEVDEGKEE